MEIRALTRADLNVFIHSDEYKNMPELPISWHRAVSQINNPRSEPDDVLLILIYLDFGLAGYLGLLPDIIFSGDKTERVAWMSCIWVSELSRGKGIAAKLVLSADDLWKHRLLITEFTIPAGTLYDKLGIFRELREVEGLRAYRRLDLATRMPARNPSWNSRKFLLQANDWIGNLFLDLRLAFLAHKLPESYSMELNHNPDEEFVSFSERNKGNELFRRSGAEWKWMADFPWIKQVEKPTEDSFRYSFSSEARYFRFHFLKIRKADSLVAAAIVMVRDGKMKVHYSYINQGEEPVFRKALWRLMKQFHADVLTVYNPGLSQLMKQAKGPFFYFRPIIRKYRISKQFPELPQNFHICDGDGDCGFT